MRTLKLTSPGLLLILATAAACSIFLLDLFYLQPQSAQQAEDALRERAVRAEEATRQAIAGETRSLQRYAAAWSESPEMRDAIDQPASIDARMTRSLELSQARYAWLSDADGTILRGWQRTDEGRIEPLAADRAKQFFASDGAIVGPDEGEPEGLLHTPAGSLVVGRNPIAVSPGGEPVGQVWVAQRLSGRLLSWLTPAVGGNVRFRHDTALPSQPNMIVSKSNILWIEGEDELAVAWITRNIQSEPMGYFQATVPVGSIMRQVAGGRRMVLIVLSLSMSLALLVIVGTHMLVTGPVIRLLKRLQKIELGEADAGDLARNMHGEPLMIARRLEEAFDKLAHLSKTDQLTGLANRRHFEQVLDAFYYQARRYNRPLSLITLDIDFFKAVNDTIGHAAGDDLLKIVSEELEAACRKADLPARLGGDEFAVLLPETPSQAAGQVAERFRLALHDRPMIAGGVEIKATSSIGIADLNAGAMDSPSALMALADKALYAAKELGRDQTVQAHDLTGLNLHRGPNASSEARHIHSKLSGLDDEFKDLFLRAMEEIVNILGERDPNMANHARNVKHYATLIAQEMELPQRVVERVQVAAMLHDIGMLAMPDSVLLCEGKLDLKRIEHMRQHTLLSVRIMEGMDFLEQEIPAVRYHHERWDGKGYPEGIAGSAIPLSARIIAVADTFDAITSARVYRGASDRHAALGEIRKSAGTQFDPVVVEALIAVSDRLDEEMMPESQRKQAGEYAISAAHAADTDS
ncbi:MAG: diguanylate cyclase [Phycisphaerae bacterium]